MQKTLVRFDGYTIYKIYIKDPKKIIWVRNVRIYENMTSKIFTTLLDFEQKQVFNKLQIPDKQELSNKSKNLKKKITKLKRLIQKTRKTWTDSINEVCKKENESRRFALPKQAKNQLRWAIKLILKARNHNLIYTIITQLDLILENNGEEKINIFVFITLCNNQNYNLENSTLKIKINLFQIWATFIQKLNTENLANLLSIVRFNV